MLPRPSLDDLRTLRPDLSFALFAMEPGQGVTLEIYHDGHVYPFRGATVADAILAAFPPTPPAELPRAVPADYFDKHPAEAPPAMFDSIFD